jgi:hypothetical protein
MMRIDGQNIGGSWTLRTRIAGGAVMALTAVILLAMGRVPWCACGTFRLWISAAASPETSQQLTDPYTFSHILHGFGFFWIGWLLLRRLPGGKSARAGSGASLSLGVLGALAIVVECGWEILENTPFIIDRYRANTSSLNYYGDSVLNSMGDVAAMILGFSLAARLPFRVTLALTILTELVLLVLIRDNRMLNIIMFSHPVEAIKRWQLGG